MKLRRYEPGDGEALCSIHDAARCDELRASGLADAFLSLEQTAENEGLFDGDVVVAEIEGRVCGFTAYTDGELTWLYVEPAKYKRGIGRALLRHAIDASSGTLSTEVLVGNEPALSLYRSEGFQILRRVGGKLAGNEGFAASGYALQRTASGSGCLCVKLHGDVFPTPVRQMSQLFDPAAFAQRQLDAYNARDLGRFVAEYTDDVEVFRLPGAEPVIRGKQSLGEHYARNRFNLPDLHARLVNRMVFGNKVIDQEYVTGVPGAPLEVAAIYEVTPAGISKVWFVS